MRVIGATVAAVIFCAWLWVPTYLIKPPICGVSPESTTASNLATVRQCVELYKVQHDGRVPTHPAAQLTGNTDSKGSPGGACGPYLRSSFPRSPLNERRGITIVDSMPAEPPGVGGWMYARDTGEFRVDHHGRAPSGYRWFDL